MNEAQTELELIIPALKEAGWGKVEGSKIFPQYPISQGHILGQGRRCQPLKADFVLICKNQRLAVVESKKRDFGYTEGVTQAKDYAERFGIDKKNAAQASVVIKKALENKLIKAADPEHPRGGYEPIWA
jgi:type I restriction enzyme, R subunit